MLYVNPAYEKVWGRSVQSLYDNPQSFIESIHEEDKERVIRDFVQYQSGEGFNLEYRIVNPNEEIRWIKAKSFPVKDNQGNIIRHTGIATDITELKKVEFDLKTSVDQVQRILDNLQEAYFQGDETGKIRFFNPSALEMFRYKAHELNRLYAVDLYQSPSERQRFLNELNVNGKVNGFVSRGLRADGTSFWASINGQLIFDDMNNFKGTEVAVRDISEMIEANEKLQKHRDELNLRLTQSVKAISKIGELRDVYTAGHQRNVEKLACAIALEMKLSEERTNNLSLGALIHDIGKVYIPSDILNKPGKITPLEYQIIQTHVEQGYQVVKEIDFPEEIHTMVYQHHERLDGSGYPLGLSGDDIILESRILGVADVVEAMVSYRPYRSSLGIENALEEIQLFKGIKYDVEVVEACVKLFKEGRFAFEDVTTY
jgi:PAS domain S-box-containing protein/putative nucleotidyltransferase with HDIG domain